MASSSLTGVYSPNPATDNGDLLAEQRRLIQEALARQGGFYQNNTMAQGLQQALMAQVSGTDQPYTQAVRNNLLADNADAAGGAYASQRHLIDRAMANAGLSGSGIQASAMSQANRQIGAQVTQGRRDVNTRADLENYSARERAQSAAMSYLSQQQQNAAQVTQQEVGVRSQMNATGDAANVAQATGQPGVATAAPAPAVPALSKPNPARPTQYGLSNVTLLQTRQDTPRPFGVAGGGGFQNIQTQAAYDPQQVAKQQQDRAWLTQLQANWDSQYGGK